MCEIVFWAGYLKQVCVNKLGASHARGLVELRLEQNGNVLGGWWLLIGQVRLRLPQLRCLHTRVAVQRRSWQHHGRLRQAVLHECLLWPKGRQSSQIICQEQDTNKMETQFNWCVCEWDIVCVCVLPIRLQGGTEQVLWLRDWRSSAKSKLGLVGVLMLRLTLQRSVDWNGNLLHCCWL